MHDWTEAGSMREHGRTRGLGGTRKGTYMSDRRTRVRRGGPCNTNAHATGREGGAGHVSGLLRSDTMQREDVMAINTHAGRFLSRLATSVRQLRRDQMEQGPTEPHAGRSTFLLSSGGAGGGYY